VEVYWSYNTSMTEVYNPENKPQPTPGKDSGHSGVDWDQAFGQTIREKQAERSVNTFLVKLSHVAGRTDPAPGGASWEELVGQVIQLVSEKQIGFTVSPAYTQPNYGLYEILPAHSDQALGTFIMIALPSGFYQNGESYLDTEFARLIDRISQLRRLTLADPQRLTVPEMHPDYRMRSVKDKTYSIPAIEVGKTAKTPSFTNEAPNSHHAEEDALYALVGPEINYPKLHRDPALFIKDLLASPQIVHLRNAVASGLPVQPESEQPFLIAGENYQLLEVTSEAATLMPQNPYSEAPVLVLTGLRNEEGRDPEGINWNITAVWEMPAGGSYRLSRTTEFNLQGQVEGEVTSLTFSPRGWDLGDPDLNSAREIILDLDKFGGRPPELSLHTVGENPGFLVEYQIIGFDSGRLRLSEPMHAPKFIPNEGLRTFWPEKSYQIAKTAVMTLAPYLLESPVEDVTEAERQKLLQSHSK
jgi:hypothetical protein